MRSSAHFHTGSDVVADAEYRAERPDGLRIVELDTFTAIYHRASGITHLVAAPVPEILAVLGEGGMTCAALIARLGEQYDLLDAAADETAAALGARLDELVAAGLVRTI